MKYRTHDNGGSPFEVHIKDQYVSVHKAIYSDDDVSYEKKPIYEINVKKAFVGKSVVNDMTKFSGGHGKRFDGNTILLHIKDNNYVYVGEQIYSFKSLSEIVKYISPVGNSDVPYPYAIDKENNVYLMISDVILLNLPKKYYTNGKDPYTYLYNHEGDREEIKIPGKLEFNNTVSRLPWDYSYKNIYNRKSKNKEIKIKYNDKTITKQGYFNLMKKIGKDNNILIFNKKIIVKRQF